jgi:hypothetical protein
LILSVAGVGQKGRVIHGTGPVNGGKPLTYAIDHRLEQVVFLRGTVRLRLDDDLIRVIGGSDCDIALHHAMATLERGTFRIGDVALDRSAFGAEPFGRGGQRSAQLAGVLAQGGDSAFFMRTLFVLVGVECFARILLGMRLDQMRDRTLHLRCLALEIGAGATPLFGGVRR